jgi:hypothetical protein
MAMMVACCSSSTSQPRRMMRDGAKVMTPGRTLYFQVVNNILSTKEEENKELLELSAGKNEQQVQRGVAVHAVHNKNSK